MGNQAFSWRHLAKGGDCMTPITVPALNLSINLADIFSVMSSVWSSVWVLLAVALGAPFAFYLAKKIRSLIPKG